MEKYMTVDQIITSAKNDIDTHIAKGTFKGYDGCSEDSDDQENFYTITSLYAQWAEDERVAELALDKMYEEDYPEYIE